MNHNFATVDENHRIIYAPDTLGRSLRPPSDFQYNTANYWEIDKTVPEAPDGMFASVVKLGNAELGDIVTIQEEHVPETDENGEQKDPNDEYKPLIKVVRKRYEFLPIPTPEPVPPSPKRYSRKKFYLALARRNVYTQFKAWAEAANVLNGLTVWELLQVSTYLQSDDQEFVAMKTVADATFGAELIDAVLAESEDEEW